MEESRQASVELMGTADYTGCGVQHSLQFVGRRFRRTRQDSIAVVNARRYKRMYECGCRFCVEWTSVTLVQFTQKVELFGDIFAQSNSLGI